MKLSWKDLWLWRVGTGIVALMLCANTYAIAGMAPALINAAFCLAFIRWIGQFEITHAQGTKYGTLPLWIVILGSAPSNVS